eukprot:1882942-Amphidinium_carterae.1
MRSSAPPRAGSSAAAIGPQLGVLVEVPRTPSLGGPSRHSKACGTDTGWTCTFASNCCSEAVMWDLANGLFHKLLTIFWRVLLVVAALAGKDAADAAHAAVLLTHKQPTSVTASNEHGLREQRELFLKIISLVTKAAKFFTLTAKGCALTALLFLHCFGVHWAEA